MSTFSERLGALIGSLYPDGRANSAFAKQTGVSEGAIRSYLAGAQPRLDTLVQIAQGTGANIPWLTLGVGPMFGPDKPQDAGHGDVDVQLMMSLITMVEEKLTEAGKSMLPAKKAEMIAMMYAFCVIDSAPKEARDDSVKQMMNVMLKMAS